MRGNVEAVVAERRRLDEFRDSPRRGVDDGVYNKNKRTRYNPM
jgi:hypothetical protein